MQIPDDLIKHAPGYGGMVHGTDANGATDIEFDSMAGAAAFVKLCGLEDRTRFRDTPQTFADTVVITVSVAPWPLFSVYLANEHRAEIISVRALNKWQAFKIARELHPWADAVAEV